tara:strand:+ start:201 stop:416 length:216 start_codon:yes stop_codon:yes gene_type:complete
MLIFTGEISQEVIDDLSDKAYIAMRAQFHKESERLFDEANRLHWKRREIEEAKIKYNTQVHTFRPMFYSIR